MADYIINFTDPANGSFVIKPMTTNGPLTPIAATPLDPQATAANTSIVLLGKGMFEYGERVAETMVHMLEHFAYATAPAYPVQGQIWYDNVTPGLFVYDGASWQPILVGSFPISGDLDMGGFQIFNLGDPDVGVSGDTMALNRLYADGRYVNVTGDTMTGGLTISAGNLTISTGNATIGGTLDMTNGIISNVATPVAAGDGVNKSYVDSRVLDNLADVVITAPINNQALIYNFGLSQWENQTVASVSSLDDLTDVTITAPSNNQVLTYNFGLGQWENQTPAAFTDRYVVSGAMVDSNLTLTMSTAVPSPTVVIGGISPLFHTHTSTEVYHNVNPTNYDSSYYREGFIDDPSNPGQVNPNYPYGIDEEQVFNVTDQALYGSARRAQRDVVQGDGTTSLYDLNIDYVVEANKLYVYNNGVKQYASQRARAEVTFVSLGSSTNAFQAVTSNIPKTGADTAISAAGTYYFTIAIDGGVPTEYPVVTAGARTFNQIASDMQAVLVGVDVYWDDLYDRFLFVRTSAGPAFSVALTRPSISNSPDIFDQIQTDALIGLTVQRPNPGTADLFNIGTTMIIPNGVYTFDIQIDNSAPQTISVTISQPIITVYEILYDIQTQLNIFFPTAAATFRDAFFTIWTGTVGSGGSVYVDMTTETLFTAMATAATTTVDTFYGGSYGPVYAALTAPNPDEFEIQGDYTLAFETGMQFVVTQSTGNDGVFVCVADATFAAGITTIYVANGAISVNEAAGAGTGFFFFARDFAYEEVGDPLQQVTQVLFVVPPAAGAILEFTSEPPKSIGF